MLLITTVVATLVVLAVCCAALHLRVLYAAFGLKSFPGPRLLPVIANLTSLMPFNKTHVLFHQLHETYGDIVRLVMPGGAKALLLVRDPVILRKILTNREAFAQRGVAGDGNTTLIPQGLSSLQTGHVWAVHRRTLSCLFSENMLRAYSRDMQAELTVFTARLRSQTGPVNIHSMLENLTLDIIGRIGFGHSFNVQTTRQNKFSIAGAAILAEAVRRLYQPTWMWKSLATFQSGPSQHGLKVYKDLITSQMAVLKGKETRDTFLGRLLDATDPETGNSLTASEIQDELINMLAAGHESTANLCAWAVHLMATNPDCQAKLHKELDEIIGPSHPDTELSYDDVKKLTYLHLVMKETLRLYPTVPMFARYASQPCDVSDKLRVPQGTQVLIPTSSLHRNPRYWKAANTFDPERFRKKVDSFAYLPFGAGRRTCIGQRLANAEAAKVLATLFFHFKIDADLSHPVDDVSDITLGPKRTGVHVIATSRCKTA